MLLPHILWFWHLFFFNIFMIILLLSLEFIVAFFFFLLDLYTGLFKWLLPIVISSILFLLTSFFIYRSPFSISFRMGLVLLYFFSFCFFGEIISPYILNDILDGWSILGCKFSFLELWIYLPLSSDLQCFCREISW